MTTSFLTALVAASLVATPAAATATEPSANQPAAAAAPAAKNAASTEEKKICKQLDLSGSRLPRRACLTAKEWKQVEEDR